MALVLAVITIFLFNQPICVIRPQHIQDKGKPQLQTSLRHILTLDPLHILAHPAPLDLNPKITQTPPNPKTLKGSFAALKMVILSKTAIIKIAIDNKTKRNRGRSIQSSLFVGLG